MSDGAHAKLTSIQGLRALAAWAVVTHHAGQIGLGGLGGVLLLHGASGVDVFFVISGFVMVMKCGDSATEFLRRRIARILPLYWLTTLIVAAVVLITPSVLPGYSADADYLIKSLLFIPAPDPALGGGLYPVNTVGWTLELEVAFYAVVALGLLGPRRLRWPLVATLVLALRHGAAGTFYANPIIYEFLFGVGVAFAWRAGLLQRVPRALAGLIGLAALAALAIGQDPHLVRINIPTQPRHIAVGIPACLLVCAALRAEPVLGRVPRLAVMGEQSYAAYLIHPLVLFGALASALPAAVVLPASAVAIASLSALSSRWIEHPARRWISYGLTRPTPDYAVRRGQPPSSTAIS